MINSSCFENRKANDTPTQGLKTQKGWIRFGIHVPGNMKEYPALDYCNKNDL